MRKENMTKSEEKKNLMGTILEKSKSLELLIKELRSTLLNKINEWKVNMEKIK